MTHRNTSWPTKLKVVTLAEERHQMNPFFVPEDQIDTHVNSVTQEASQFATIIVGRLYATSTSRSIVSKF